LATGRHEPPDGATAPTFVRATQGTPHRPVVSVLNGVVRLVRSLAGVLLLSVVLAGALPVVPAGAAPLPVLLGQVGSAATTGGAIAAGGCDCTVAQMHEGSPTGKSYVIPYDGVIVASGTYVGNYVEPTDTDTVQVQTVNRTGATTGNVVSAGTAHHLLGLPKNTVDRFYDRVPAHAGDVLAARFHDSGFIESTPFFFKATATADEVQISSPIGTGGSLSQPANSVAERRVNLEAVLEPDGDHDGYGDASQDLCPGSSIATSSCSGALFGSDLQDERSAPPAACLPSCMYVQTALGGASTAATSPGVIVRWRILNGSSGAYRIHVLTDNPGGSGGAFHAYHVLSTSETGNVTAPLDSAFSKISSFPTRLPIPVGAYVGLTVPGGTVPGFQSSAGGQATYSRTEAPFPGISGVVGESHNGEVLYDADIEPDLDGDGYGDVSQDSCPSSASIHEGPCPAVVGPDGGAAPDAGQAPTASPQDNQDALPKILSLAVRPKSFHAKPLGRVPAGGSWGTKVKLSLSSPATVTLAFEARHGRRYHVVTRLTKNSAALRTSVSFDGQYRLAGKLTDLRPGTYRLTASAKTSAGTGPVKSTTFTVLPPA
jgi:hypothetical protein